MERAPKIEMKSKDPWEHNTTRTSESPSTIEVTRPQYIGSPIGDYLLRKALDEGKSIRFADENIELRRARTTNDS